MNLKFENILNYLSKTHGLDFSLNQYSSFERKINYRMDVLDFHDMTDYLHYLEHHSDELSQLIDALTINVSRFFRNALTFDYIAKIILPKMIAKKAKQKDHSLRIWSAGCAMGEEPYSIAILINEIMKNQNFKFDINIFATDINRTILRSAREGIYHFDHIKDVRYGLLREYFAIMGENYVLNSSIKEMINFSFYDMIDPKTYVPPESVFGNFDIVLCRNLLIYFKSRRQEIIFDKLFRSLVSDGFLVLGGAERLPVKYEKYFLKENNYCHIYHKYP